MTLAPNPRTSADSNHQNHQNEPGTGPAPQEPPARTSASPWRALLLRLHFYAGVFVAPFLVVAAVTGLAFVFSPQLDGVVYDQELHAEPQGRDRLPLAQQVSAARAAHPEGDVYAVVPPGEPGDTTRVEFALPELGEKQHTVFVDPYTAQVRGELTTWYGQTPLMTWLDDLHRNLLLGDLGRHYSEIAASWLWVIALGGLVLWWQRLRRPARDGRRFWRRAATADLSARGVRRTRSWHAATGVWIIAGLLVLSATGLTWSRYAGDRFTDLLLTLDADKPDVAAAAPGHHGAAGTGSTVPGGVSVDQVVAAAAARGVDADVSLTPPAEPGAAWLVEEVDRTWPVGYDRAVVDPATAQVVTVSRFADWPLPAKLSKWGVQAHMGYLFGLVNQLLLAALAIGLLCVIVWGYRMWWQRRPTGTRLAVGPPPKRGAWRGIPLPWLAVTVAVTAAVGWALPLLGVTLIAFLLVDVAVGLRANRNEVRA